MIRFRLLIPLALLAACTTSKKATVDPDSIDHMQFAELPEMTVTADADTPEEETPKPAYKPADERTWDLIHTRLDLSFDIPQQKVIGRAELTLTPVFYTQQEVRIDAVGMTFSEVRIDGMAVDQYRYDGSVLTLPLDKPMRRDETLRVDIAYSAVPSDSSAEASAAITSDKGLFFIDPLDTLSYVPLQIWSQGETTFNSKWFPTFDQPNERHTQEVSITVADSLMTISNGSLVNAVRNPDGTRTDTWRLDLPHAPYLTMVAVGQWDKVSDFWRGRPVDYYVDKGYGPSARAIFAHTPEMLDFFSRILGYDFVWPKYAQVVVKEFVSGAMENTTAVTFGDFVQFYADDMIEEGTNDYIVAHEMFHHWFGDLVTCESWANLVLNEGFANYAEYRWYEFKYGRERADLSRLSELSGYFDQAAADPHPLVHYHYDKAGDMFDAHSYNKGGLVLHMLRDVVGDEAFFASLQYYLRAHDYDAAEIDDLRQAFETVTGRDLNWFFDPWYFGTGHPVLAFSHTYEESAGILRVSVTQKQEEKGYTPLFVLPMEIGIIGADHKLTVHQVRLDQKTQEFAFNVAGKPLAVIPDPRDILLAEMEDDPDEEDIVNRILYAPSLNHRISAWRKLGNVLPNELLDIVMIDSSQTMRRLAAGELGTRGDVERLGKMADAEYDPLMQYYLLELLASTDPQRALPLADRILGGQSRSALIAAALGVKAKVDPAAAVAEVRGLAGHPSSAIQAARITILSENGQADDSLFLAPEVAGIADEYLQDVIHAYARYLSSRSPEDQDKGLAVIQSDHFRRTPSNYARRFYTIAGLVMQYNEEPEGPYSDKLAESIKVLYEGETDSYLREVLKEGLGDLVD